MSLDFNFEFLGAVTAYLGAATAYYGAATAYPVVCKPILVFSLSLSQAEQFSWL